MQNQAFFISRDINRSFTMPSPETAGMNYQFHGITLAGEIIRSFNDGILYPAIPAGFTERTGPIPTGIDCYAKGSYPAPWGVKGV